MDEISIKDLFRIARKKIIQIIIIIIFTTSIGVVYNTYFKVPKYEANGKIVLNGISKTEENINYFLNNSSNSNEQSQNQTNTTKQFDVEDISRNQVLLNTYAEMAKSEKVLNQVISNLKLDITLEDFYKTISIEPIDDTMMIEISAINENAQISANIVNEIMTVLTNLVDDIYKLDNVYVIDEARIPDKASNINPIKEAIIFVFVGIILSMVYVLIKSVSIRTVKNFEDFEKVDSGKNR